MRMIGYLHSDALDHVIAEGIAKDRQDALAYRLSRINTGGGGKQIADEWGIVVEGADYLMHGTRIGEMSFDDIAFGECPRFPHVARGNRACGGPREINQRTFPRLCAGLERVLRSRPKRIPSRSRAEDFASNLREQEAAESQKMAGANQGFPRMDGVLSVKNDFRTPHHDRDFRAIFLPLEKIQKLKIQSIRIAELTKSVLLRYPETSKYPIYAMKATHCISSHIEVI